MNDFFASTENNIRLNILNINHVVLDDSWKSRNVYSPYSRMYYILDGEGYLKTKDEIICLKPGNLYFIPLGTVFDYTCDSHLEKIFLHINLFLDNKLDFFSGINKIVCIPSDNNREICTQFHCKGIFSRIALKGLIYTDLLKIARASMEDYTVIPHSRLVADAISYINNNLSIKLSIKEIADAGFVSPSLLRKKFLEEMNISIGKYIDTRIIFEAEQMLAKGDLNIDLISEALGFCDRFYFTRRFKEQTGITPGEYKKQVNSKGM